jgi:hypothetical protein
MKKILFILLLIPITAISQDTLHIPAPAAKAMVQQLVSCDSVKAIHELTKEQLTFTEKKVEVQDSIISGYQEKTKMYKDMLNNEQQKFKVQELWVDDLRKDNRRLKAKLLYTKIIMSSIIAIATYVLVK